jgi:hypothetical protein
MNKTLEMQIEDLIEYLKREVWSQEVSLNTYGTTNEDSYLSGINEGIDRAYRVLAELNIKGYIIREENK